MATKLDDHGRSTAVTARGAATSDVPAAMTNYSTCYLFDTTKAQKKLLGLSLANCTPAMEREYYRCKKSPVAENSRSLDLSSLTVSSKMTCSICSATFPSRCEQIQHYKLDWHRYNLKQKILGMQPISEDDFDKMAGDISSLSGSESDTDESDVDTSETNSSDVCASPKRRPRPSALPEHLKLRRPRERTYSATSTDTESEDSERSPGGGTGKRRMQPKAYFRNAEGDLVALYRCIIHSKKAVPQNQRDLIAAATRVPLEMNWAIILIGGGHFAAGIFNGEELAHHKTFHRYTVRAKQGKAQGSQDGQGSAKSAGAALRRHNEAALVKDIQGLLSAWADHLQRCSLIFFRAVNFNRVPLFGGKNPPFKKDDGRLRTIPFASRRATCSEVIRVHRLLATVECFGAETDLGLEIPQLPKRHLSTKKGQRHSVKETAEEQDLLKLLMPQMGNTAGLLLSTSDSLDQRTLEESANLAVDAHETSGSDAMGGSLSDSTVLAVTEEIIDTSNLKEFYVTRKPRQKKKRKGNAVRRQPDPTNETSGSKYELKNNLYTACKTGDITSLCKLLCVLTDQAGTKVFTVTSTQNSNKGKDIYENMHSLLESHISTETEDRDVDSITIVNKIQSPLAALPTNCESSVEGLRKTSMPENDARQEDRCATMQHVTPTGPSETVQVSTPTRKRSRKNPEANLDWEDAPSLHLLNEPVSHSGATLLHVASREGHAEVLRILLEHGADPSVKDKQGRPSYAVASKIEVINEFQKFMTILPDSYAQSLLQLPGALTEEEKNEWILSQAEKKREKRKAKKEREKEKKAGERLKKIEEEEKQRFLALSDREKRAVAAEKRFAKQTVATGLRRCFQCATDITGQTPFEYSEYIFCSMPCLKQHRKKIALL